MNDDMLLIVLKEYYDFHCISHHYHYTNNFLTLVKIKLFLNISQLV